MALLLRPIVAAVLLSIGGLATASAADAERRDLAAARQRIEADYAARASECRQQFVVTACIDAAQATRREGLSAVRTREAEIDDRERRQRGAARQSRIDQKQQRLDAEPGAPLPLVPAPEPRRPLLPRTTAPLEERPPLRPKPDEAVQAARFDARQREAQLKKDEAARREAERQRSGKKPAAPLAPVAPVAPLEGASAPMR